MQKKPITRETALMLATSPGTRRALCSLGICHEPSRGQFGREPGAELFGIPRVVRFRPLPGTNSELLCNTVRTNPAGRDLALQQLSDCRDFEALAKLGRENAAGHSELAKQYLALALSTHLNEGAGKPEFDSKPLLQFLKTAASSENEENAMVAVSWLVHLRAVSELVAVSIGANSSKIESYAVPASLEAVKALHATAFNDKLLLSERASAMMAFPIIFKNTVHPEVRDFLRQKFPQKFK